MQTAADESQSLLHFKRSVMPVVFLFSKAESTLLFKLKLKHKIMRGGINE